MTEVNKIYNHEDVENGTLDYFNQDRLATNVWMTKYALKNKKGEFVEKTPDAQSPGFGVCQDGRKVWRKLCIIKR